MKKTLILALAPLFIAAGCATGAVSASAAGNASAPASGAQYCKKDRLATEGDALVCNWAASVADACELNNVASVKKSTVSAGPANAGRCSNGQWLVSVTTK
jgi:hypothetical protein